MNLFWWLLGARTIIQHQDSQRRQEQLLAEINRKLGQLNQSEQPEQWEQPNQLAQPNQTTQQPFIIRFLISLGLIAIGLVLVIAWLVISSL